MIKTYVLMGSLILSGVAMIGGVNYYQPSDNNILNNQFAEVIAPQSNQSVANSDPVLMPLWMMQKMLGLETSAGTPVPCPVWMLYNMNKIAASPKPKI